VADNASTDDSVSFTRTQFPEIKIIQNPSNNGFAGGYNEALQHVQADIYVLLNQDVEVEAGWIEPVIAMMEREPDIVACQPKLRAYADPEEFEYAGAAGGWMDILGYTFCRGRILYTTEKDTGQYDDAQEIFWATGAALFIRSKCFHEVGGFDADFFAHMEEVDLCWRLQRAVSCGWGQPATRQSTQIVPQFPEQPDDAMEEPAPGRPLDHTGTAFFP
jgi:GT2 family glycosyltransferase